MLNPLERIFKRTKKHGECIFWSGYLKPNGYGQTFHDGKLHNVHRLVWELTKGPLPKGLVIDHLCRQRACVNILHLEPVTMRENIMRGESPPAVNNRKEKCVAGHTITGKLSRGDRWCRKCDKNRKGKRDWSAFNRRNPDKYLFFEREVLDRISNGSTHLSSKKIIAELKGNSGFKIDPDWAGCLSRWFEFCHPEYSGIFQKRHMQSMKMAEGYKKCSSN